MCNMIKKFFAALFCIIFFTGCGQDYNSNSSDLKQYSPIDGIDTSTVDGVRLLTAYKVFQTKCFQCHQDWADYKTSEQWTSAGKVVAGSAGTSSVWTFLKNNGGSMPPDPIAQLTSKELADVEAWISGI